jgi:CheY-like chemotaxis protein
VNHCIWNHACSNENNNGGRNVISEPRAIATVLLVDDEAEHLRLRAHVMTVRGFSVITAGDPLKALSMMERSKEKVDVAVLDYHMPEMSGCVLADHLRSMRPEMKIILNSGAIDIPKGEMTSVDVFIPKGDGIARLLAQVAEFAQATPETADPLVGGHEPGLGMSCGRG